MSIRNVLLHRDYNRLSGRMDNVWHEVIKRLNDNLTMFEIDSIMYTSAPRIISTIERFAFEHENDDEMITEKVLEADEKFGCEIADELIEEIREICKFAQFTSSDVSTEILLDQIDEIIIMIREIELSKHTLVKNIMLKCSDGVIHQLSEYIRRTPHDEEAYGIMVRANTLVHIIYPDNPKYTELEDYDTSLIVKVKKESIVIDVNTLLYFLHNRDRCRRDNDE